MENERYVTREKFGEMCGVTGMAIKNSIDAGRVALDTERNKIDTEAPVNIAYKDKNNHQRKGGERKSEVRSDIDILNTPLHLLNEDELKRRRVAGQITKDEIKNDQERGKLIEFDLVVKFFLEMESMDKKQFVDAAKRCAPQVMSLLEADSGRINEVVAVIEGENWKVFLQKKAKLEQFIKSLTK